MTCEGAQLLLCNQQRTGWELFDTCASAAHCNAGERQCLDAACAAGEQRCNRGFGNVPGIETCLGDPAGWQVQAACETRELCEQTLSEALTSGGLELSGDNTIGLASGGISVCNLAACTRGEARCVGARLEICNEGRTGFDLVEQCATAGLCAAGSMSAEASGVPRCQAPACAPGAHQCTDSGALQVCNQERTGYDTITVCLGPAFCNPVLADQGGNGCTAEPCAPSVMQCNGAQIERCREDSTGYDDVGDPCASEALCNDDDPSAAACGEPACRRGELEGSEFRCVGAGLERCTEDLTGYAPFETCATPELCDASLRFGGCAPPVCEAGQFSCNGAFLAQCNVGRSGFEDVENCGTAAQCDANAGRCADPCEPGAVRCNSTTGDLEECRDPLTGWQVTGDCLSLPLCDAQGGRCLAPVCQQGERRCARQGQTPVVEQCAPTRDRFEVVLTCQANQICDAQSLQCDNCVAGSVSCQGDTLVRCDGSGQIETRQQCGPGLCDAGQQRCLACDPLGSARCADRQLFVCGPGPQGREAEFGEFCETDELCGQTLRNCGSGLNGQSCQCNPGACRPGQISCSNGTLQRCNEGLTAFDNLQTCAAPQLCNAALSRCDVCVPNQLSCGNAGQNQLRQCNADGSGYAFQNSGPICNGATLVQCVNGVVQSTPCGGNGCNAQANPRRCNTCSGAGFVRCAGDSVVSCSNGQELTQDCGGNGCNAQRGTCNQCNFVGTRCSADGARLESCVNGLLQTVQSCGASGCNAAASRCNECTGQTARCFNGTPQRCNNGLFQNIPACQGTTANRCDGAQLVAQACTGGLSCSAQGAQGTCSCTPSSLSCAGATENRCNAQGTGITSRPCGANGCGANGCNSCAPNSVSCNGNTQTTCSATGTPTTRNCPGGCVAGVCRQCAPNTFVGCSGSSLVNCNADGTSTVSIDCGAGGTCDPQLGCVRQTLGLGNSCAQLGDRACTGQEVCLSDGRTCGQQCAAAFTFASCGPDNLSLNCAFGGNPALLQSQACAGGTTCSAALGACVAQ